MRYSKIPKHFILIPLGTTGDINPFLWIGHLLRNRGHEVTLIPITAIERPWNTNDLKYLSIENPAEIEAVYQNPRLWHPWDGLRLLFTFVGQWTERIFRTIQACQRSDMQNVIVAPSTAFGARLAREKLNLPLGTVHLQPCAIQSIHETPGMRSGFEWMGALHWIWQRFFHHMPTPIDFYAGPGIRQACWTQQILPPKHILNEWWHSPDGILCLFPKWFSTPRPDWPMPWTQSGFPLHDTDPHIRIPDDLEKFLHSGSPPILFTLGSGMKHPGKFFETSIQACALLKRRGLLVSPPHISLPNPVPPHIFSCHYIPFSWLFPKVEAVVHHGGIGTLSQALVAGIPQLIMPFGFDQPDNAARLVKLGVARTTSLRQFTAEKVSKELNILLTHPQIRTACTAFAQQLSSENTTRCTIDFLENLTFTSSGTYRKN